MEGSRENPAAPHPPAFGAVHVVFLVSLAAGLGLASHTIDGRRAVHGTASDVVSTRTPVAEFAPRPSERRRPNSVLSPTMRMALEHTARRYRLSMSAMEPTFVAVEKAAAEVDIDPLLIVAVIAIESRFNPYAESAMGAQGLMQVIPRFHGDKLRSISPAGASQLSLFDPVLNVRVGIAVLSDYLRDTGDIVDALQRFAGAWDDPAQSYTDKVLGELERLQAAIRSGREKKGHAVMAIR